VTDSDHDPRDAFAPPDADEQRAPPRSDNAAEPADVEAPEATAVAPSEPGAEQELWSGRTDWRHYIGRFTLWAVAVVGIGYLLIRVSNPTGVLHGWRTFWAVVVSAILLTAVILGKALAQMLGARYRLTTQRLFIERGILRQTVDQTELIRVDDVRIERSIVARVLGIGSVIILSTDASDHRTVIPGVSRPQEVAEHIRTHMRRLRRKSLYVENL
jgi:membrane protein YdbS with pleckstrin-like domain